MNFDIPDVYRKTLNNNSKCYSSLNGFFSIGHLMLVHRNSNSCIPFIDWSSIKVNEQRVPDWFYAPSLDFPCVVSLLCGKTADVYRQLFYELQEYADRLDMKFEPSHIMSDFEISLIKAVRQTVRFSWLKTTIQCYIHRFRWPNITSRLSKRDGFSSDAKGTRERSLRTSQRKFIDFFDYVPKQSFKHVLPEYWVVSDLNWRTSNFSWG